jgi:RNA polymerase sigma-70 factor (ECF subfamily)
MALRNESSYLESTSLEALSVSPHKLPDERPHSEIVERSFVQHRGRLRWYFRRRAPPQLADDLVQEVYERLLRYESREPLRDPISYLFAIASNVAKAANRRVDAERRWSVSCDGVQIELLAQELKSLWVHEEGGLDILCEDLERELMQLPADCYLAIVRHRRDGWTYDQIAAELGITRNAVKGRIVRALDQLRKYCFTSS